MIHQLSIFLILPALLLNLVLPQPQRQTEETEPSYIWVVDVVDTDTAYGVHNCFAAHASLALDSGDVPHVSYYTFDASALMYATRMDGAWVSQVVDNSEAVGRTSSIALDSTGKPHISYRDMTKNDLKYASWDGGRWDIEVIGDREWGWYTRLKLDSMDRPHIAYLGRSDAGTQTPKHTHWNGTIWETSVITPIFGSEGIGLALDHADQPHVSYRDGYRLQHAVLRDGGWIVETVDGEEESGYPVGSYSSIAIDTADNPHISYALFGTSFMGAWPDDLKYAVRENMTWKTETVDAMGQVGFFSVLALDEQDRPHITYQDSDNETLKYAILDGNTWHTIVVDRSVRLEQSPSMAIDQTGLPQMVYCNAAIGHVVYARAVPVNSRTFIPTIAHRYSVPTE